MSFLDSLSSRKITVSRKARDPSVDLVRDLLSGATKQGAKSLVEAEFPSLVAYEIQH
jgi:hypothetical protein